jgi:hypothetical protein
MADKVELYSTIKGNEVTKPTEEMKQDAWRVVAELGIHQKGRAGAEGEGAVAALAYVPKLPAFVMSFEGATPDDVASFREAMAYHRTDAAQEAMVSELRVIQAGREGKLAGDAAKAPLGAEVSRPDRVSIALFPTALDGPSPDDPAARRKSETAAMLTASDRVIGELGLKGQAKNSYDLKAGNWVVGGRGLADDAVRDLGERLAAYRTPEAEQAWRQNAPDRVASPARGPQSAADISAALGSKRDVGR